METSDALRRDFKTAQKRLSVAERDKNLADVAWKALEVDPSIAAEAILEMSSETEDKQALISAYIQLLVEQGKGEEAATWAASLGNANDTQTAHSKLEELAALSNPEQDALALSESNFTGEVDPAAEQVVRNWATKNPTQAADWLRKMPEGEARANGFRILLGAWVVRDPSAALSWISKQPSPQFRQETMTSVVGFLGEQPTPLRNALLENADETLRNEILQQVAEKFPAGVSDEESQPEPGSSPESGSDDGGESDIPEEGNEQ